MNKCTNQKYEKYLYAYELGILSDEELYDFEIHQLECEYCYQKVKSFKQTTNLLRHDPLVKESLAELAEDSKSAKIKSHKLSFIKRLKSYAIAAALVVIVLLLKPWNLEFKSTYEASAAENRIVVLYFKNLTNDPNNDHIGEVIANLLITDLAESNQLQVVSSQRLYDVVQSLRKGDIRLVYEQYSNKIAEKLNANLILSGAILQSKPNIVVTAELIGSRSGVTISSIKQSGEIEENIFSVVDQLTVEIKRALNLSTEIANDPDPDIKEITTHSSEAYQAYLEGLDYYNKYYFLEAIDAFKKAVDLDSTFASAYYYLAMIDDASFIEKAVKYAGNASTVQQHFIYSRAAILNGDIELAKEELREVLDRYPEEKEAHYWLGSYSQTYERNAEEAVFHLRNAIELDSLYKNAYNKIAYAYIQLGACEKAIWAINKYVSLADDEANPHDSRGEIYSLCGDLEEAIESYQEALRVRPTFTSSLLKLGIMYVFQGDYDMADSCFSGDIAPACCISESSKELYISTIYVHQGRLNDGIEILRKGMDKIDENSGQSDLLKYYSIKAFLHWEKQQYDSAYSDLNKASEYALQINPNDHINVKPQIVRLLFESGRVREAENLVDKLKPELDSVEYGDIIKSYVDACFEMYNGNFEKAAELLENVSAVSEGLAPDIVTTTLLAKAYLETGAPEKSAELLEIQLKRYNELRAFLGNYSVKLHYLLGQAYEAYGSYNKAIQQYKLFLTIWENADHDIPSLNKAKLHLKRLEESKKYP
ncbi:MAG: tetratricopeptide repeat protein [Aliifodinibius sp.]|nr:tetratricopeptide repeat protein [candidate division Zixibacteria bacterium]NIT59216.1 tetratricopeptide repeat protein [Fodinibius sp.]NIW40477.1 tetratricopeptide repeat protein [candidate division Zixibacteria bacterium]NIX57800.1 tetratricopeptide repeat protein [candidate division Zixibacteria bacterium]NIY27799.1 tetratricopeptide repeat protein [Fodinibius sp.]